MVSLKAFVKGVDLNPSLAAWMTASGKVRRLKNNPWGVSPAVQNPGRTIGLPCPLGLD
jgi:hypothetical protein